MAVQPRISPARLSHGAIPPCLGFGEGPVRRGPLPHRLRGGLESKVALFMPGVPISARPATVQPLISPARLSRGVTPPCLGFGEGPSQQEEMMLHPLDRLDVTALATHVNKCTEVNWTVNFNTTGNRKMMKNGLHIFKFSDFLTSLHLIRRKNIFFCPTTINCGRPWPVAYINFNQNTHQIQVLTKPLCRAQAIFYSLPNNEWGTKYCGLTYSAK